jgi:hypothetical protein
MSRRVGRQNRRLIANTGIYTPIPTAYGVPLTSLAQWHRGDLGVTLVVGKVSNVVDQTGNGRDWVQATDASRPTMSTVNSLAAINFSSGSSFLQGPSLAALTGGAEWLFVSNMTTGGSTLPAMFGSYAGNGFYPYVDGTYYMEFGSTSRASGTPVIPAGVHLIEIVSVAGEMTLTVDAVQKFTTGTNVVGWHATLQYIGQSFAGFFGGAATLGESIIAIGKLSGADRASLRAGLKAKWGTP